MNNNQDFEAYWSLSFFYITQPEVADRKQISSLLYPVISNHDSKLMQ